MVKAAIERTAAMIAVNCILNRITLTNRKLLVVESLLRSPGDKRACGREVEKKELGWKVERAVEYGQEKVSALPGPRRL